MVLRVDEAIRTLLLLAWDQDEKRHIFTINTKGHQHRHARSIFTAYAILQHLLGGAVIFFNLTLLLHHFIYVA